MNSYAISQRVTPQQARDELERRERARTELKRREAARSSLEAFAVYTNRAYLVNWHHAVLCQFLDRFVAGEIRKLMVFMPPQHGKSQLVSRALPAYLFGRNPDQKIIATSYAAELIQGMNRDVQRLMEDDPYTRLFPDTRLNSKNIRTDTGSWLKNNDIFEVVNHQGQYRCAGVGGGITGFPADVAIIDDPYKDFREAMSGTVRKAVWDWYNSTLLTRTHNDSRILLTLTRWHPKDLAGMLLDLEGDEWIVLRLPALCEDPAAPNEQRATLGEALWPDRFSVAHLTGKKRLNSHLFEAVYQQNPQPREGGMFKREWFEKRVKVAPADAKRVRSWDLAATEGDGDWTAGPLVAESEGRFYVEDVKRVRLSVGARNTLIKTTAAEDARRYGNSVSIWGPQDPGSAGKEAAEAFVRMLAGFPVHTEPETGSKEIRAQPFADQCEAGNVYLVEGDWNEEYVEEFISFGYGGHDDQVDATSRALAKLAIPDVELVGGVKLGAW